MLPVWWLNAQFHEICMIPAFVQHAFDIPNRIGRVHCIDKMFYTLNVGNFASYH